MSTRYLRVPGSEFRSWWLERYGTDAGLLDDCSFWKRGRWNLWVAAAGVDPGAIDPVEGVGIPFLRLASRIWKPSGVAAMHYGSSARRNVVDLEEAAIRRFLVREDVALDAAQRALPNNGFVIVRWAGVALGVGEWRGDRLVSMVAKGKVRARLDVPGSGGADR